MYETPNYTEINVIDNYAPTAKGSVLVTDAEGQPVADATVEFKVYNYAEFYTGGHQTYRPERACIIDCRQG